jgi:chaperonin GroES
MQFKNYSHKINEGYEKIPSKERNNMKLKPVADRVVVKPEEKVDRKVGHIIIPDTQEDAFEKGIVVAVGPGRVMSDGKRSPMQLKTGDKVIYNRHRGFYLDYENEKYVIILEIDVLSTL